MLILTSGIVAKGVCLHDRAPQSLSSMLATLEQGRLALSTINSGNSTYDDRKSAEAVLSGLRSQRSSLGLAVQVLQQQFTPHQQDFAIFCAQTVRLRLCVDSCFLDGSQRLQLRQLLVGHLSRSPSATPMSLTRQICLSLAALAAVDPSYNILSEVPTVQLPLQNAVELLQLLAEEGCSDWRHVVLPGISGSRQLDWATETRERFRSWSPTALQLLHSWLEQQKTNSQLLIRMLSCLTAWVRLGALHTVDLPAAEQTAQIGLTFIQSSNQQVVSAALDMLSELPEYAPEQLLLSLQPHMMAMAQSACQAAARAGPVDLMHAAAWVKAFAAYVAEVPQELLQSQDAAHGVSLSDALLQVSILPHLAAAGFVCLPALELWSTLLDDMLLQAGNSNPSKAHAGDTGLQPVSVHLIRSCLLLLIHTAANWLLWQQDPSCMMALEDEATTVIIQGVCQLTCQVVGADRYLAAVAYVWGGATQEHQQHSALLPLQRCGSKGWDAGIISGLLNQADLGTLPVWQQQQLQAALESIAAEPGGVRLQTAVLLAAAVVGDESDGSLQGPGQTVEQHETAGLHAHSQAGSVVVQLLSSAAANMQQTAAAQQQLALPFCQATRTWSRYLVYHFASPGSEGSGISGLLQLLLSLTASPGVAGSAAAALRTVVTSASKTGWHKLHMLAPLLMEAISKLSCSGRCEQDLLASLAACLAAPGMNEQQQQQIRVIAAQELVQPGITYINGLLQQLQSGITWCALAAAADAQLCRHLAHAQAVLEGCLMQQQQDKQRLHQPQQQQQDKDAADTGGSSSCEDDDALMMEEVETPVYDSAQGLQQHATSCVKAAEAAAEQNPAVQLLLGQLWPQLHCLVKAHSACGSFLHHYSKCCCRLLKIRPCLLMPQFQQYLQVAVVGMARPGGCSLAESLRTAVALCCKQESVMLREIGPLIMQALSQLWSMPEVAGLTQPKAGDQRPDLAEHILKLYTTCFKYGTVLQHYSSTWAASIGQALATAVGCASCSHKKVARGALLLLSAVLTSAISEGPQHHVLLDVVFSQAVLVIKGVLGALLAPCPLPRLQMAANVLLELANIATVVCDQCHRQQQQQGVNEPAEAQQMMYSWVVQAASQFVPGSVTQAEAMQLAAVCSSLFNSAGRAGETHSIREPVFRSYIPARKLKKVLRDFAERHTRATVSDATSL